MLVLSRKMNESVEIDGDITVTVISYKEGQVKLGFTAPKSTKILRTELTRHDSQTEDTGHDLDTAHGCDRCDKPKTTNTDAHYPHIDLSTGRQDQRTVTAPIVPAA